MADSRQYWLDDALRRVAAEQQRNPEVLSRDFSDPRFANRPMQPAPVPQESYAGWLGDVIGRVKNFRVPQGPQIPGARTPLNPSGTLGGGVNMLKDMLISTGEDFGAEGGHKDTPIPMGKLAAAGLFPLRGIGKVAKSLRGVDDSATVKVKPSTTPKEIPSNLSNDPKLERWPDQIPEKGKGRLQDQPDFPINHPAKTEFGKHWGNMADESGYTDLIANYNPTNSPLHTPEKAKEAFYQMLDMDPHKRFVNHDSKTNYDIHTIFREIEKFAQNPSDMSVINFNRYKHAPFFWQWGRN